MIVNGIAWRYVGFSNVGGYCTFDSHRGGSGFSAIFQFVPRGIVVVVIIILYTHLFFFLRRIHLFRQSTSSNMSNRQSSRSDNTFTHRMVSSGCESNGKFRTSGTLSKSVGSLKQRSLHWFSKVWKRASSGTSHFIETSSAINSSQHEHSSSSQGKESTVARVASTEHISMTNYRDAEVSPNSKPHEKFSCHPSRRSEDFLSIDASTFSTNAGMASGDTWLLHNHGLGNERNILRQEKAKNRSNEILPLNNGFCETNDTLHKQISVQNNTKDLGMISPSQKNTHYPFLQSNESVQQCIEETPESKVMPIKNPSTSRIGTEPSSFTKFEDELGKGWAWGMPVGISGPPSRLATVTQRKNESAQIESTPIARSSERRFLRWNLRAPRVEQSGTGSNSSSQDENGVESIGSTLNRQASVLLLLYPAVYVLLFGVSIIRIIVDLSASPSPTERMTRQNDALHAVSRWTIFAQGAIDAIIFQVIEGRESLHRSCKHV